MFTKAIVRKPSPSLIDGITTSNLGKPDFLLAEKQHQNYIESLIKCGLKVQVMRSNEEFPDSTFIEDTAVVTKKCAIVTQPAIHSRKGEIHEIKLSIKQYFSNIEYIKSPGTIEGGDVLMVGDHFYIGISQRTNEEGAVQMITLLNKYGFSGSVILLKEFLHLKTGISYLENNTMLVAGELLNCEDFKDFNIIQIDAEESYAANSIWINGTVIMPLGYPRSRKKIFDAGYDVIEVDVSEFRKIDGGMSCLSLRF